MKRHLFFIILAIFATQNVSANKGYKFEIDGLCYDIPYDDQYVYVVPKYQNDYGRALEDNKNYVSGKITIPAKVVKDGTTYKVAGIGSEAFKYCNKLTEVIISDGAIYINSGVFQYCSNLKSIFIPKSLSSIGEAPFVGCERLNDIEIDKENKTFTIVDGIIYESKTTLVTCISSNENITIPDNVTKITSYAFKGCNNLVTIKIGSELETIQTFVFDDCHNIKHFYCSAINPPLFSEYTDSKRFVEDSVLKNAILYVPLGTKDDYELFDPWKNFFNIEEYDFSGVEDALVDEVLVSVENDKIVVNGAETVEVYSIDGKLVYSGSSESITVPNKGTYIVLANGKSYKVAL